MESIDSDLIELLERKAPEHLSIEEIERLSTRLDKSPELQTFLIEQLQMEQYLAAALSRIDVRVDDIIAGRRRQSATATGGSRFGLAAAVALLVLGGVVAGGVIWYRSGRDKPEVAVVDAPPVVQNSQAQASDSQASGGRKSPVLPAAPPQAKVSPLAAAQPSSPSPPKNDAGAVSAASSVATNQRGADAPRSPWESQLAAAPRSWASVVLAPPPSRGTALTGAEAAQWLVPPTGLSKLQAPWPADAMLRLRLPLRANGEVRLWKGKEGVLLNLAGSAGWSAYRIERDAGQQEPKHRELWETDDGLYWKFHPVDISGLRKARGKWRFTASVQANDTPVDIYWHDGYIHLWRGDLRLVSAPLAGPPDEVWLNSAAVPEHLSMVRIEKPPAQPRYEPSLALDAAQPATLAWTRQAAAPATIENVAGSALKITAPESAQPAKAFILLPAPGVCDVVFTVQGATNGTGVYLGGADGAPIAGVQVVETAPGRNEVALQAPWEGGPAAPGATAAQPAPIWARLLVVGGAVKCWQSRDGRHWALLGAKPLPAGAPPIATYGVYVAAGAKPARAITLSHVQVRGYSGMNSLVPADLLARAAAVPSPNPQVWKQGVTQSLPGGVDRGAWHRAVALRTLSAGTSQEMCTWLLRTLLADAARLPRTLDENRRLLAELPELAQLGWVAAWGERPPQLIMGDLVVAAGAFADAAQADGETRPFSTLGWQVIATRMGPFAELNYEFPANLLLPELMQLAAAGRFDVLEQTARTAQLYARDEAASAAQWAIDLAARRRKGDTEGAAAPGAAGQLTIDSTKAQRMFMADLNSAIKGRQWSHASQMITRIELPTRLEMFADPSDPMVFVTPAAQIAALVQEHPPLAAQMKHSFTDKGRLRVRFAINDNNPIAVAHAATQFAGTPAAAEAYQWLGDQVLQDGDAVGALTWYAKARPSADVTQRDQLDARMRLANARLGRDVGSEIRYLVRRASGDLTGKEFEELVQKARSEARTVATAAPASAPGPSGFRVEPLAAAPADRPWLGEGLALDVSGGTLVAHDARTVVAWDLAQNKPRWQRPLGEGGAGATWLPQLGSDSVVVAIRAGSAAQVHRLNLATGEPLGKPAAIAGACFPGFELRASGDTALAFSSRAINNKPTLVISSVDLNTGQMLRDVPLLPHGTGVAETCPPLVTDGGVLVFVEGGIVCCESAGVIRWIRRQHATATKREGAPAAMPTRSLAMEGDATVRDAIVWQPRVPYVERIDMARGHRKWLRMLPDIRRIIGIVDGRVIVEANERIVALGATDGKVHWSKPLGSLLSPAAVGAPGGILITRAKTIRPADPNQPNSQPLLCPELVWLDPANGQMRGVWPLESLTGEQLVLGPWTWTIPDGTIFMFFGNAKDPARQLLKLVPQGAAQPPREDTGRSVWDGA